MDACLKSRLQDLSLCNSSTILRKEPCTDVDPEEALRALALMQPRGGKGGAKAPNGRVPGAVQQDHFGIC